MRELKFRAWDGGQMMQHHEINESWFWSGKFGKAIIMQYTGVKDRYGVCIFEGDIVEKSIHQNGYEPKPFPVKWLDEQCGFNISIGKGHMYEVIGNIYETTP
jgi:uncharacterized phage protein (TIGR01671 family)